MPEGYILQAQANLASFINRTDGAHFRNELYRNVDFLITDLSYKPRLVLEINDRTHLTSARRERDEKVKHICEEAGIPIIRLWTSYGVNREYIQKRIAEELSSLPVKRIHHFTETKSVKGGTVVRPAEQRPAYTVPTTVQRYGYSENIVIRCLLYIGGDVLLLKCIIRLVLFW